MQSSPLRFTLFPYTTLFRSKIVGLFSLSGRPSKTNDEILLHLEVIPKKNQPYKKKIDAQGYPGVLDRKSTRLNSSHVRISYAVFCLKKKTRRYFRTKHQHKT